MKISTAIISSISFAAVLGGSASSSSATTLQFENVVAPGGLYYQQTTSYTESGYTLDLSRAQWAIVSPTYGNATWFGPAASSDFFSTPSATTVTLTNSQTGTFSLASIDVGAGIFSYSSSTFQGTIISFRGLTDTGVNVSYDFAITDSEWHTYSFNGYPEFKNLQSLSVAFSNYAAYSMALDNINVSAVPIPQGFYLLSSALLPLISTIFRKKPKSRTSI